jgi:hypothetical protein
MLQSAGSRTDQFEFDGLFIYPAPTLLSKEPAVSEFRAKPSPSGSILSSGYRTPNGAPRTLTGVADTGR